MVSRQLGVGVSIVEECSLHSAESEGREQASEVRCQLKAMYVFVFKIKSITNLLTQDSENKIFWGENLCSLRWHDEAISWTLGKGLRSPMIL